MKPIVVVTTVGNEEQANLLAEELVVRRQACCVNILPVQRSVYRWQGKICEDSEYMLIVKTAEEEFQSVQETIQELHQYELPEILSFPVGQGESNFLAWMSDCLAKGAAGTRPFPKPAPPD